MAGGVAGVYELIRLDKKTDNAITVTLAKGGHPVGVIWAGPTGFVFVQDKNVEYIATKVMEEITSYMILLEGASS